MEFQEFYIKLINILDIYKFVLQSKVCPETSSQEWLRIITYLYLRDWLWVVTKNSEIKAVIGAYRINEFCEEKSNDIPEKDEGNILFIPFACSTDNDIFIWKNLLREYLRIKTVNRLIFCDYKKDGYKKYKIFKIGDRNGSKKITTSRHSIVLSESITAG